MKDASSRRAFTLIEILIVVAIMAILAGIILAALNPRKHMGEARDVQRINDVNAIINAVHQYAIDHGGQLPLSVPLGVSREICMMGASCNNGVDLDVLTGAYLPSIPFDPAATGTGTDYFIMEAATGLLTVTAPNAEQQEAIQAVR